VSRRISWRNLRRSLMCRRRTRRGSCAAIDSPVPRSALRARLLLVPLTDTDLKLERRAASEAGTISTLTLTSTQEDSWRAIHRN